MFRASLISALTGASLLALSLSPTLAANHWTSLGKQPVGFSADRDVFNVGWTTGRYDALKFKVTGNQVAIADVVVHYGNGTSEHLNVKEHLQPGEMTPAYDLKGEHRIIKRIEVLYQTEGGKAFGNAKVEIFGAKWDGNNGSGPSNPGPGNPTPTPQGWETLGSRAVGFFVDHDYINVGANKGKFVGLKLDVKDHDIFMYNLRVRFQNGDVQDLPVNSFIKAGSGTGYLDLPGAKRTIDRIDMVYRTKPGFYGMAHVTVSGKH